jgi:hypothetical protein
LCSCDRKQNQTTPKHSNIDANIDNHKHKLKRAAESGFNKICLEAERIEQPTIPMPIITTKQKTLKTLFSCPYTYFVVETPNSLQKLKKN